MDIFCSVQLYKHLFRVAVISHRHRLIIWLYYKLYENQKRLHHQEVQNVVPYFFRSSGEKLHF